MKQDRRTFIKTAGVATAGLVLSRHANAVNLKKNKLPQWRGFNLLDCFSPQPKSIDLKMRSEHFKWMRDWGFDFVRLPMAYPSYIDFDRSRNILPEETTNISEERTEQIEELVYLAQKNGLHVSLNLHRAPGYCINAGFHEPYNLWLDEQAQKDFCFHWEYWVKKFKNHSPKKISFDLLNEPSWRDDMNDQLGSKTALEGEMYRNLVVKAVDTIKAVNKKHLIIADGNNVGNNVTPELFDLDIGQSCRGYFPGKISHHKASWAQKNPESMPDPTWPLIDGERVVNRESIQKYYQPWIELAQSGGGVHCGECGCYNKTPHEVFLSWFGDVLSVLSEHKIGFGLWEFSGSFGVLNSGRIDVDYEDWYGQKLDRKLLTLLQNA